MDNQFVTISFALLKEGSRDLDFCSEWPVKPGDAGLFVIQARQALEPGTSLALYWEGRPIWEAALRVAPRRDLNIPLDEADGEIYITTRVILDHQLPEGDGILEAALQKNGVELAAAIVSVLDARRGPRIVETAPVDYPMPEETLLEAEEEPYAVEAQPELQPEVELEFIAPVTVEPVIPVIGGFEEVPAVNLVEVELEEPEALEVIVEVEEPLIEEQVIEETIEPELELTAEEEVGAVEFAPNEEDDEMDLKTKLFGNFIKYDPVHVDFLSAEEIGGLPSMKKSIVVEKIGNFYVTVLNDFLSRPVYFLYNGEQIVEWDKSLEEYLAWMKNITGKMYNIPASELKEMEKLVIVSGDDEVNLELDDNITWVDRSVIIEGLSERYSSIVDLTMEAMNLRVKLEEEGKYLHIESKGLGLGGFLGEGNKLDEEATAAWREAAQKALAPLGEQKTLFLGLAAFEGIYNNLEDLEKASELPFVSLAWEVR